MDLIFSRMAATVHNILYVMAEGNAYQKNETATRKTIFLFLIDFLQVVRVITSPLYGWSKTTSNFVQNFDIVYLFTDVTSTVVPRYSFFIFASIIVLVALGDTVYVAHLFSQGDIQKLWPVKVLRFLVAALVTTFFSSVIKWLLIPVDCVVTDEKSMSSYIHGPDITCDPMRSPEIIISIPTLMLAVAYCLFALTASLFWLEINPLSCSPSAKCTGRVEMCFLSMKIAATFLVYLSDSISTVGTSVVLCTYSLLVFVYHLRTLPFHDKFINQVRGGIHAALMWLAFTAVVVSAMKRDSEEDEPASIQSMEWAFIGCIPGAAILGAWAVYARTDRLALLLDRLRGVWETNAASRDLASASRLASPSDLTPNREPEGSPPSLPDNDTGCGAKPKSATATPTASGAVFNYFYNPSWERKRAFGSSSEAYAAIRVLLHKRDHEDLPFLLHVMHRGMDEFPQSHQLKVLHLLLVRFVFEDQEEESVKKATANLPLSMDLKYAIYAVDRKRSQEQASASLGRGNVNAINLMEYDSGLEKARKAHTECVSHLRTFWHLVGKRNRTRSKRSRSVTLDPSQLADKMLDALGALDTATSDATAAYQSLLHKYPTSLAVLTGYSHFCDVVLNDGPRARMLREKAMSEEVQGPNNNLDDATIRNLDNQASRSQSSGSESAHSWRSRVARTVETWIHLVMSGEREHVFSLRFRGRLIVALLVLGITASFVVSNVMLYSNEAKKYMLLVRRAGELRINLATSAYELRSHMMVAKMNPEDLAGFNKHSQTMVDVAEEIRSIHYENYRNVVSPSIADLFSSPVFAVFLPTGGFWTSKRYNLWDMVNDAARRSELAARCSVDELRNESFSLPDISEEKRNIAYVHENWLRTLAPSLDKLISGYEEQMRQVGAMIQSVIYASAAISSVVILVLSLVVLRALVAWLQNLQHRQMACLLAASLPPSVSRKLYLFYHKVDIELKIIEDEEMERMFTEGKLGSTLGDGDGDEFGDIQRTPTLEPLNDEIGSGAKPLTAGNLAKHVYILESPKKESTAYGSGLLEVPPLELEGPSESKVQSENQIEQAPSETSVPRSTSLAQMESSGLSPRFVLPANARRIRDGLEAASTQGESAAPAAAEQNDDMSTILPDSRPQTGEGEPAGKPETEKRPTEGNSDSEGPCETNTTARNDESCLRDAPADPASDAVEDEQVDVVVDTLEIAGSERDQTEPLPSPIPPKRIPPPLLPPLSAAEEKEKQSLDNIEFSSRSASGGIKVKFADAKAGQIATGVPSQGELQGDPQATPLSQATARRSSLKMTSSPIREREVPLSADGTHEIAWQENGGAASKWRRGSGGGDAPSQESGEESQEQGEGDDDPAGELELRNIDPAFKKRVKERLEAERGFFLSSRAYICTFLFLLGFNLLFHLYPARTIGDLVNLAPMIDMASRRVFHTLALAHLSRELILDDGFSRLSKGSLVGAINEVSQRMEEANHAIRFGNSEGIKTGADARNEEHNSIMYSKGCPWRDDPSNCTMMSKTHAADSGLLFLVNTFMDSLHSVVMRYAGTTQPDDLAFVLDSEGHVPEAEKFNQVRFSHQRAARIQSDVDVAFLQENFEGDMTQGLRLVMRMFSAEADTMLGVADKESEVLYAVFIVLIIGGYHVTLFRRTIRLALAEADKAKEFVLRQPIHTLEENEHRVFASFFSNDEIQIGAAANSNAQD